VPELANSTPKFAELQAKHGESELKAKSPVYYELGHGRSETNARDQVFELGSG
jgi:hypothetical protein